MSRASSACSAPRRGPGQPRRADALLRALPRLERADPAPVQEGGRAAARRGLPRLRGAVRHRRHRRRHRLPRLLHGQPGRPAGLLLAEPARHGRLHRLRLGLPQHPRDRTARRRPRPGCHGGLRLHGPARRDADLGGGRRPRGDGHPVAALPRDDPHDRRVRRGRPALRPGPALVLRRHPLHRHRVLRAVQGHLRPLLPPLPAADRRPLLVRQGHGLRGRDHPDPLLLRLHAPRAARPGWAWPSARRCAPRSWPSTSSTSSSRWRSGAPRPRSGSRGSRGADECHQRRAGQGRHLAAGRPRLRRRLPRGRRRPHRPVHRLLPEGLHRRRHGDAGDRPHRLPAPAVQRRQDPGADRRRGAQHRDHRRRGAALPRAQARDGRPDPGRRLGAAAAQDALRRALRGPGPPGGGPRRADPRRRDHPPGPHHRGDRAREGLRRPAAAAAHGAAGEAGGHAQRPGQHPRRQGHPARPEPRARRPATSRSSTRTCPPSRRTSPAWPTWPARMPWRHRTWSARPPP